MSSKVLNIKVGATLLAAAWATACQSTAERGSSSGGSQATAEFQMSSDRESLMANRNQEAAIKARSALVPQGAKVDASLQLTVAELSLMGQDVAQAREAARQRLRANVNDVEAMNILIRSFLAEGKLAEAKLMIENAQAIDGRQATTLNLKGLLHHEQGQPILARESWKLALKYDPTYLPAMMNLGALYFHNRNVDQAGIMFEKILAQNPNHLDARMGFALVRYAQGQAEQGRGLLEKVADAQPNSPLVYYNLAILERDGFQNNPKALAYMERFVNLASSIPSARKSLENGLQVVTQLKSRIAVDKQKLSDADLRAMAGSPTTGSGGQSATPVVPVSPAARAQESSSSTILNRDVQSLEDAIK
jgi:tetratricopeptide (TPR) repeat protein